MRFAMCSASFCDRDIFTAADARYGRIKSPVEFSAGFLRRSIRRERMWRMLPLAAACDRQDQELFHPPNVSGWAGGRTWLNSTTLIERGNWCNDVIWGNDDFGMPPFDVRAWAERNDIPLARIAASLIELLLSDVLDDESRRQIHAPPQAANPTPCAVLCK